ncbi:hypothetical protein JIR001_21610 [Polycladomyces abyssicola]|uniref:Uncharacterized protein n=1 Tax=Polycladomyces abyssicola TaxID=1125966 RepID=A0A8D5UGP9_9BACL|nr:hypothetical protein [Polycladomyces abyssicola]BCU82378.1 hypothetical protein JIR001_21610 [Polycladomyces abyssicola]
MISPMVIGALSVNEISNVGKVNVSHGLNFLAHNRSIIKANVTNFYIGDASVHQIVSPINDRDIIDTAIIQVKAV